jgi:exopolysaccharide production negative regulator
MRMCNRLAVGALAALMMMGPAVGGGDDPPPFASATDAYRQGANALKAGRTAVALPALEYAAKRGVLGAQLKLARAYASGRDAPKDDAKAFSYFQEIADHYADISPSSPVAKFVGESFVALGQYYADGIPAMSLAPNPSYAADLFRHAASYFGNADAQYRLARLYLNGDGVEKNVGLAVNWLATAAKKQHVASQATLGEILWRGENVRQRQARGLALIVLAHENAVASGKEPKWIGDLYQEAFAKSDKATRKEADALLPELAGGRTTPASVATAAPDEPIMLPATEGALEAMAPTASAKSAAGAKPSGQSAAPPPASIGLSIGFGPQGMAPGDLKP